jgi:hypothetical protein
MSSNITRNNLNDGQAMERRKIFTQAVILGH